MINIPELVTFAVYLLFLLGIGIYFYYQTKNIDEYLLGGRKMGRWVTALSAQASDMSGWLLMGLPGAMYVSGMSASWIAVGLFLGTWLNWKLVAPRLREFTEKFDSLTLPEFFEARFKDPTGSLRVVSALVILFFFTIYASSGLVAAGKLFESMFGVDYKMAVLIGALVIVSYTFLGGFLAVSWTDLFQGILMFFAILVVPIVAFFQEGGCGPILEAMSLKGVSTSFFSQTGWMGPVAVVSTMAWGFGYFGQPHILARFMAIKSVAEIPKSMRIALIWVFISLIGAMAVGLIGVSMFPNLSGGDEEKVFILMVRNIFNPWVGGILLAAILSAIMSTIDSQLLVSSSALTEDLYKKFAFRSPSEKELVIVGRLSVVLIAGVAFLFAMNPGSTVLGLVSYAWGGFGAAFGPVVLMALFSEKTRWQAALSGMLVGTGVLVIWKLLGAGAFMYEIVPGFIANFVTILLVNRFRSTAAS